MESTTPRKKERGRRKEVAVPSSKGKEPKKGPVWHCITDSNTREKNSMRPDFDSPEWRHTIDSRNRYLPSIPIYDKLPEGWRVIKNTLTQPSGTCWICNGPFFKLRREGKQYKHALMWL